MLSFRELVLIQQQMSFKYRNIGEDKALSSDMYMYMYSETRGLCTCACTWTCTCTVKPESVYKYMYMYMYMYAHQMTEHDTMQLGYIWKKCTCMYSSVFINHKIDSDGCAAIKCKQFDGVMFLCRLLYTCTWIKQTSIVTLVKLSPTGPSRTCSLYAYFKQEFVIHKICNVLVCNWFSEGLYTCMHCTWTCTVYMTVHVTLTGAILVLNVRQSDPFEKLVLRMFPPWETRP